MSRALKEHAQVVAAGGVGGQLVQRQTVPPTDELAHLAVAVAGEVREDPIRDSFCTRLPRTPVYYTSNRAVCDENDNKPVGLATEAEATTPEVRLARHTPAGDSTTKLANGATRSSNASLSSSTFSGGRSTVDSAPTRRPSTCGGRSSTTTRRHTESSGEMALNLATFLGVDTKVTVSL
ncbi:hypothetical protein ZEAMMB73_Zm00001d049862 [Zea mays]|uniref:Uncharacterized protein n=1 Tax=Zea mays TaxID=4577 RepID=A0A1D6PYG4_MAIZE|nr:hypothetical protein ZEAMMB73_Zm00001d049862 [Zea mays]